jgi:hypothetical protein
MRFKIPSSFQLAGVAWTVEEVQGLDDLGLTHRDSQLIQLQAEAKKQTKEIAFFHEIIHAIKFAMGEDDHDEIHTDAFGQLLHQVITTMR